MTTHVVGAGGVGFWLSAALAREGVKFTLWDADTLEGGLGYTRLPKASPTTYKVELLRGFCVAVLGCEAPTIEKRDFTGAGVWTDDLVIDCTDMALDTRRLMWSIVKTVGARMIRVSYDGRNDTIVVAEGLPLASKPGGGYAEVPSLALSFVAGGVGATVVKKILDGFSDHVEFQISIKELVESDLVVHKGKGYKSFNRLNESCADCGVLPNYVHSESCNGGCHSLEATEASMNDDAAFMKAVESATYTCGYDLECPAIDCQEG